MATTNNNSPIDMKQLWQKMEDFPLASSAISAMTAVEDGDSRYMYYLVGAAFYRYDLKANMTTKLASPLVTPTNFASLRYSRFGGTLGRVISSPSSTTLRIGGLNAGMLNTYKLRITSGAGAGLLTLGRPPESRPCPGPLRQRRASDQAGCLPPCSSGSAALKAAGCRRPPRRS